MGLIEALGAGTHGVTLRFPETWTRQEESDAAARLVDPDRRLAWFLFFFPGMRLDLSPDGAAALRRDVETHARYLLASMVRREIVEFPELANIDRPTRSPLVSCDAVTLDGRPALSVVHRMVWRPGRELIMGHMLVPVADGLFEARWAGSDDVTGFRESTILMKVLAEREGNAPPIDATSEIVGEASGVTRGVVTANVETPPEEIEAIMRSTNFDDPTYDAMFAEHVLSRVRSAERWLREEAGVRIGRPAAPPTAGPVQLEALGCAIVLPARFYLQQVKREHALFLRVSLAGNDGVQILVVEVRAGVPEQVASGNRRTALDGRGMRELSAEVRPRIEDIAIGVADGENADEQARAVCAVRSIDAKRCVALTLITTPAHAIEEIEAELVASLKTAEVAKRPWWKLW